MIHCSSKHEIAIGQPSSLSQQDLPLSKVDSLVTHISAETGDLLDCDGVACQSGEFLNDNRVASVGHHTAGEDTRCLFWADFAGERMAGGDFAYYFKRRRDGGDIGSTYGISIHCRHRDRGLRP